MGYRGRTDRRDQATKSLKRFKARKYRFLWSPDKFQQFRNCLMTSTYPLASSLRPRDRSGRQGQKNQPQVVLRILPASDPVEFESGK